MEVYNKEWNADVWTLEAVIDDQEEDFLGWWNELDEDAKHMLHSLAIYSALGGKLNAFSVQETGVDLGVIDV